MKRIIAVVGLVLGLVGTGVWAGNFRRNRFRLPISLWAVLTLALFGVILPSPRTVAAEGEDPTTKLELTASRLDNDVAFRRSLGFRADPGYVRSLYAARRSGQLASSDSTTGTLFTAQEAREWRDREAALRAATPIQQKLHDTPDPTYGGLWLDHQAGGLVTVAFTRDVERREIELRALTTRPDRLRMVRVEHSLAELDACTHAFWRPPRL